MRRRSSLLSRTAVSIGLALVATGLVVVETVVIAAPALASTDMFGYTGAAQSWVVPPGVTSATFTLYGAQGGASGFSGVAGGLGGSATATFAVTPGATINIYVGGAGEGGGATAGGFNGGGTGSSGLAGTSGAGAETTPSRCR